MKKQILSAAIAAVLMTANAQAALPTISTNTTVVYMAGSSTERDALEKLITAPGSFLATDRICDPTQPIWVFKDNIDGKTQNAYYCAAARSANTLLTNAKSNLLIYKRSEGGSDYGVTPLVADSPIHFLNISAPLVLSQHRLQQESQ